MLKKIFLLPLFVVFCLFIASTTTIHAQEKSTTASPQSLPYNTTPDVPRNLHTYTQATFIEILAAATCAVSGIDPIAQNGKCLGIDTKTKKLTYVENSGGLALALGGMIGSTFNIPISTQQYGRYLAGNFGITRTSYAATTGFGTGIGFKGLTPVLQIWVTFRNLTYLIFVLVFILLGLGIMFRLNIDARTVMTIQNQIPKIIIALVLITLSYAIAGFLIDMMYVGIYLVIHLFDSNHLATVTNIGTNPVMAIGPLGGVNGIAAPAAEGVSGMINSIFSGSVGDTLAKIVGGVIGAIIGNTVGGVFGSVGGAIGAIAGGIGGLVFGSKIIGLVTLMIAYLIISIAILSSLFKVWWMLIKAYIFIFMDTLFAPFWILGGVIPGSGGGVGPWLRSLIANLSAFPTVLVLFMIGKTIQEQAASAGGNFIPPLVGNPGVNSGEAIGSIIGLGIILIMPEAVNITKSTLKAPELKYTAAIGHALGAAQGMATSPIKGGWSKLTGEDMHGQRLLTSWAQKRGGSALASVFGGSFKNKDSRGEKLNLWKNPISNPFKSGRPRFKLPFKKAPVTPPPPEKPKF